MPACRVVTIARSNGAQAETIGHAVAEQLGFHFVDDEIILQAAEKAGVSPQTIGQEEHSPSRLARIMKAMATVATSDPGAYVAAIDLSDPSPAYRHLIQDVIQETAASGKVVIAAHAAGISLAGEPGVLRVFITASPDVRAKRIAAEEKLDQVQAKKQVEHSDR
ncbi:MAG: AAA family ATPase, partial [Dehalococcoidia bacterium]